MKISDEIIERVKQENNIVHVISQHVNLKHAGKNYHGLCPFHNEKTPSFTVSEEKQIYKCFGCGEAGNVISFLMKFKGLSFVESVKELGNNIGLNIDNESSEKNKKKELLYTLNKDAAKAYFENLRNNKYALKYLQERGLNSKTLKVFGIGFSLNSWNYMLNYLTNKKYSTEDMLESGLVIKGKNGKLYDRFRNRIIFPVFDVSGRVIGFGGRVLDDSKPKYLNSPETLIFHKGYNLYGLNFALKKNNGVKIPYIIIVEGYMDVISLCEKGVENVVASLGTALTENQGNLIKKYTNNVYLAYDSDNAGKIATERGMEILEKCKLETKILTIPTGKDPDEFIQKNGLQSFLKLLEESLNGIEYKLSLMKKGLNFSVKDDVIKYVKNASQILIKLDPVERDIYIKNISNDTNLDEQIIYDFLNNLMKKDVSHKNMNNIESSGQKLYINAIKAQSSVEKAELILLKIMISSTKNFNLVKDSINEEFLSSINNKKIYNLVVQSISLGAKNIQSYVETNCNTIELSKTYAEIMDAEYIEGTTEEEMVKICIKRISKYNLEKRIKKLQSSLKFLENSPGNESKILDVLTELEEIRLQLARM